MSGMSPQTVPLNIYLWRRIASIGIEHVFGVPGDFNLTLLDALYDVPQLTWLGACNELNAAYAADGYARIKGHPAALVTTYAVGEMSAMNGVAGAYAEHAGMIHIVGMTSRTLQKNRVMMHHTLEPNMDHAVYIPMAEPIRKTYACLMDDTTMAEEIDRVIIECVRSRLPVFIYVPTDVVSVKLDASRLDTPLDYAIKNPDSLVENEIVEKVLELIKCAEKPVILGDVLAIRHGGRDLARELVEWSKLQNFSTPLSKGIFDEKSPTYGGLYNGTISLPGVAEAVQSSDLVLHVGPLLSSSNTGAFTRQIKNENLISLGHAFCQIQDKRYEGVHFLPVIQRIVAEIKKNTSAYNLPRDIAPKIHPPVLNDSATGAITQLYVWQRIGRFLKDNDIVLAEAGTAQFGTPDMTFPNNVQYITQSLWSSIGYTVGATLGALVAAKELKCTGRVVLLVGEGSLQMTVQEIGSYIRFGFKPVIFVINNGGYSIERAINGPKQHYNEVSPLWNYQKLLGFFGAGEEQGIGSRSYKVKTVEELEKVLDDQKFASAEVIQLVEIVMDKFDYPWILKKQIQVLRERAAKAAASA